MNVSIIHKERVKSTFLIRTANYDTQEVSDWFVQISLKNPWLIPKYETNFGNGNWAICGWLFLYFGRRTSGIMLPVEEDKKQKHKHIFRDKDGNQFVLYGIKDVKLRNDFHKLAKKNLMKFHIQENEEGYRIIVKEK